MRWFLLALAVSSAGCAHTVAVQVPAQPAVPMEIQRVAVVTADRSCQDVAARLVGALRDRVGVEVDPQAEARLQIGGCDRSAVPVVALTDRRRHRFEGRATAVVQVHDPTGHPAYLVGTGRTDTAPTFRALHRTLDRELVDDLVAQLSTDDEQVLRRVHPRAPEGSARALHSRAVAAELEGDLARAHHLAVEAATRDPSDRRRAYAAELAGRLRSTVEPPIPSPDPPR